MNPNKSLFMENCFGTSISSNFIKLIIMMTLVPNFVLAQTKVEELQISFGWQMRESIGDKWSEAVVPGCVHSDLFRNKQIPDPYFRTNEKNLQWIDKKDWEYQTTLDVTDEILQKEKIELDFKGLDTYADVYLNDRKILVADNMFREWRVDVKPILHLGLNVLRVYFHSPIMKGLELLKINGFDLMACNDQAVNGGLQKDQYVSPFIRKAPYHFGWDWGPRFVTSGIWKPVYLKAWDNIKLEDFYVEQKSLTDALGQLNGQLEIESTKNQLVEVSISIPEGETVKRSVSLKAGSNIIDFPFEIKNPKRWWSNGLGKPNLYNITATAKTNESVDSQSREIGLRTLKLINKPDNAGHTFYVELNGVPVFAKGENHIPNDMFLDRVTKEVYDWEINTAVSSNLNMLRVWGGGIYEDDYFYDLCDRNGILVWQEFMFACSLYPGYEWFLNSVTKEADYQVKRLRNHPCIALWCGNNEIDVAWQNYDPNNDWGWKKLYNDDQKRQIWAAYDTLFNHILPRAVNTNSPQVAYWQSSPSSMIPKKYATDHNADGDVHYWGVWWGKQPFEKYADNIGRFMSEYGFQSFPELETVRKYALPEDYDIESEVMRQHQRSSIGNVTIKEYMDMYYRKPSNFEKFLYVGQVLQAYGIQFAMESHRRAMPYNMGSLVWQINDCWPVASWSSCDYYHRWKAVQYQIKRSFEPVLVSAYADGENTTVKIVSDKLQSIKAQLEMKVCDFTGKIKYTKIIPVVVKANEVTDVITEKTSGLTDNVDNTYLTFLLKTKDTTLALETYFFTQPKNLNLTKPVIFSNIVKHDKNWEITVKTDVLAKNVYLNFNGIEGFFSDNYFDLLPGVERKIIFTPKDTGLSPTKMELISLVDSYQ